MCTSFLLKTDDGGAYLGRNMDLYYSLPARIVIMPRSYPLSFHSEGKPVHHYSIMGTAICKNGYPLYCEAVNEYGLAISGLDFPDNASYCDELKKDFYNVFPFELIPFVLSQCKNCDEAEKLLGEINLVNIPFSQDIPLSPLHWHIADTERSIVFEATKDGKKIYRNSLNVMSNNPPFDFHIANASQYLNLSSGQGNGSLKKLGVTPFSFGNGGIGLPGDLSSASRLVRAAYFLCNSVCERKNAVNQVFRLLSTVSMPRGSVVAKDGAYDITFYSVCIDLTEKIYYFLSYDNMNVRAIRLTTEGSELIEFDVLTAEEPRFLN